MAEAVFVHGNPVMCDYTPGADVAAGEIVVIDGRARIAHLDIANGKLGALAYGGGVYDLLKDGTSGPDIAVGDEVFWIEADNLATNVKGSNIHVGQAVAAAGASVALVRVYHDTEGDST